MTSNTSRLQLELPRVVGAEDFLTDLASLLGLARSEDEQGGFQLSASSASGFAPRLELKLVERERPRLCFWQDGVSQPLGFSFEALEADSPREPSSGNSIDPVPDSRTGGGQSAQGARPRCAVGTSHSIAPGTHAKAQSLSGVRERLAGAVRGVDHLGLNLPARAHPGEVWQANLCELADRTSQAGVLPYDEEAQICFLLPTTAAERRADALERTARRKPKLELVRDAHLVQPMIGFAVDTDLSLETLHERFPSPDGASRPGDEDFFRSVLLAHPWDGLLWLLDLNSDATSQIEITQILVDGGRRIASQ